MQARTLGPEGGVDCDVPHWLVRLENKPPFISVWKPSLADAF